MTERSLSLPWPPTVNLYWRRAGKVIHISSDGRAYRKLVGQVCLIGRRPPMLGRLDVEILACPPDRRARDLDNLLKSLLDALEHAGIYESDSQIDDLRIRRGPVTDGGRVSVQVREIAAGG